MGDYKLNFEKTSNATLKRALEVAVNGNSNFAFYTSFDNAYWIAEVYADLMEKRLVKYPELPKSDDEILYIERGVEKFSAIEIEKIKFLAKNTNNNIIMWATLCECGNFTSPYYACACDIEKIREVGKKLESLSEIFPFHINVFQRDSQSYSGETLETVKQRKLTHWRSLQMDAQALQFSNILREKLKLNRELLLDLIIIAETIALMAKSETINFAHMAEASMYIKQHSFANPT